VGRKQRLKQHTEEMDRSEKSEFVTSEPSKLAKHKTVAHMINPRENHTIHPCH